jgi:hypothetical protein
VAASRRPGGQRGTRSEWWFPIANRTFSAGSTAIALLFFAMVPPGSSSVHGTGLRTDQPLANSVVDASFT